MNSEIESNSSQELRSSHSRNSQISNKSRLIKRKKGPKKSTKIVNTCCVFYIMPNGQKKFMTSQSISGSLYLKDKELLEKMSLEKSAENDKKFLEELSKNADFCQSQNK